MHATQREKQILKLIGERGFLTFKELERLVKGSPATLRRDLSRLQDAGKLVRVHGGAGLPEALDGRQVTPNGLSATPFDEAINLNRRQKEAIGKAAADLCTPGEAVMIDGGSTTLQMCPHLDGLNLQVLTISLHIVNALQFQKGTRVLVPGGAVFPEQGIILSTSGEDLMPPRFHAPRLFMGCAAIGPQGLMQADFLLSASVRRLIDRADELVVLADSSKFTNPSGNVVAELSEIDIFVTDEGISADQRAMLEKAGVEVIIAPA